MKEAWQRALQSLGYLIALAAMVSLVRNIGKIDLHGLPMTLYSQYIIVRDNIFNPVVWCLSYLGISISGWVKDVVVAYMVPVGSHWHTTRMAYGWDKEYYLNSPTEFEAQIRNAARINNIDSDELWRRVKKALGNKYYRYYRDVRSSFLWPRVLFRNVRQYVHNDSVAGKRLRLWLVRFIMLVFGTVCYFVWNYIESFPLQSL